MANGINDVSKDHPGVVLLWAAEWLSGSPSDETRKLLERGLRTLIDEGDAEALALLAYAGPGTFGAGWHSALPEVVQVNEKVRFEIDLTNESDAPARAVVIMRLELPGRGSAVRSSTYRVWKGTLPPSTGRTIAKTVHFANNRRPIEPGRSMYACRCPEVMRWQGVFRLTRGA